MPSFPLLSPLATLVLPLLVAGCVSIELPTGRVEPLTESVIESSPASAKILMIEIDGVIQETPESGFFGLVGEGMVSRLREELDLARKDPNVRALLLRINSPGGTATASDLIYQELRRFKQERSIPIVAQLMGLATSGGYYVAQAADRLIAQPTTVTGSIGVLFSGVNLSGLLDKVGVEDQTLTSGPFKDAGSMMRPMRREERVQLQSVLDDLYARFLQVVNEGRPQLGEVRVRALADGRIYSARQALEAGLVDEIGSYQDSYASARQLARLRAAKVVTYHRPREYTNNFYTRPPQPAAWLPAASMPRAARWAELLRTDRPSFLYLWAPGTALP